MSTQEETTHLRAQGRAEVLAEVNDERKHLFDVLLAAAAKRAASAMARHQMADIPGLSLSSIVTSLRVLGTRSTDLTGALALPAEFFSWERPAFTITVLVLYTILCYRPYLIACVPALALLTGVLIPNYDKKFPMDPALLPTSRKPVSEFNDLTDNDLIVEQEKEHVERDLLLSLRQGQHSLAKLVESLEKFDKFKAGPGNFVDIGESSVIFVIALVVLLNTALLTSFVPLNTVFVCVGWGAVLIAHPYVKQQAKQIGPIELKSTLVPTLIKRLKPQFSTDHVPVVRTVEIFELQRQGLTPRLWDSVLYSPYTYSEDSAWRLSNQLPPGTKYLADVISPDDWFFDDKEGWDCDKSGQTWVDERHIGNVRVEGDWVYDSTAEWRRRRWTRKCYHRV